MPAGYVTPGRVVAVLVVPPTVLAAFSVAAAVDAALYAVRLYKRTRTQP